MVRHVAADHGAAAPVARRPRGAEARSGDALWYKDAVIYEVHVRAFADSNDDGIGDFAGLTSRLEYIQSLGVNVIWLLPFYPSPQKDDGYDIADYRGIHPAYGTLADFREFVREAHRRGLRVITELVINHTSDQHPWFQSARRAPAGSYGASPPIDTRTRASYSPTPSSRTGAGTRSRAPITGTASSVINPISISPIRGW
jgi:glycosidase